MDDPQQSAPTPSALGKRRLSESGVQEISPTGHAVQVYNESDAQQTRPKRTRIYNTVEGDQTNYHYNVYNMQSSGSQGACLYYPIREPILTLSLHSIRNLTGPCNREGFATGERINGTYIESNVHWAQ